VLVDFLEIQVQRLAREEVNRKRISAECIEDELTELAWRARPQRDPRVAQHDTNIRARVGQVREIARVTRQALDRGIDLEERPLLW